MGLTYPPDNYRARPATSYSTMTGNMMDRAWSPAYAASYAPGMTGMAYDLRMPQGPIAPVPQMSYTGPDLNDSQKYPWLNSGGMGWPRAGAAVGGGLLALTGLGRGSGTGAYDEPMRLARGEYDKYSNPNSDWYRSAHRRYRQLFSDSAPSMDTLTGIARTGGVSATSASSLAVRQSMAIGNRNRNAATQAVGDLYQQGGGMALNALNMYNQLAVDRAAQETSFGENLLGSGMSLLGLLA